jgi:hypothetical protein
VTAGADLRPVDARGAAATSRPGAPAASTRDAWRRWWWPASIGVALLLVTVLTVLVNRPPSSLPLAPDNPRPGGARAVAQILQREGVEIAFRRTVGGAAAATPPGGTIFVTHPSFLTAEQWRVLAATQADIVLTNVAFADLGAVTEAVEPTGEGGDAEREAACADPDALAAGRLSTGSGDVRALAGDVVLCFPPADAPGSSGSALGAYAVVRDGDRTIRVLANSRPVTNAGLADAGNAALVLRVLGRTEQLTWLVPSPADPLTESTGALLPPGTGAVAAWGLLLAAVAALWRGRRLGRLVAEPLPVVVPPAETTLGRARLYRRARAHRHAAAALRAGTASRLARRVGIPDSAEPPALVVALARATGRLPADVGALLYGPAPDDDAGLLDLVRALDALESEVRP